MSNIGKTPALDGVSTLIIPDDKNYWMVSLKNLGSANVYFAWGEDAVLEEGLMLTPAGTAGAHIVLPQYRKYYGACNAFADGFDCEIQWHVW